METELRQKIIDRFFEYCEGLEWLEISKENLDKFADDVVVLFETESSNKTRSV